MRVLMTIEVDLPDQSTTHTIANMVRQIEQLASDQQFAICSIVQKRNGGSENNFVVADCYKLKTSYSIFQDKPKTNNPTKVLFTS